MTPPKPEAVRRIAVILGPHGSGRALMEGLLPLLARGKNVEMQGVFLEEAELRAAAELPYMKELCRVTFSVREFGRAQFDRTLQLRTRAAQRALSLLARRTGIPHSFRNVRGPALRLLIETASAADVTVFEPARSMAQPFGRHPRARARTTARAVTVLLSEPRTGRYALRAARKLAGGDGARLSVLALASSAKDYEALCAMAEKTLQGGYRSLRHMEPPLEPSQVLRIARGEGSELLVIAADAAFLDPLLIKALRERAHCPICLVRHWGRR